MKTGIIFSTTEGLRDFPFVIRQNPFTGKAFIYNNQEIKVFSGGVIMLHE